MESYAANSYTCDIPTARQNATRWTVSGYKIEYCLSQVETERCRLQFSLAILGAVIVMNLCKSVSMSWTAWKQSDMTLVTFGDAVASFLDTPDSLTKGRCLMGKVDVNKGPLRWRLENQKVPNTAPPALNYYAPSRRRWFSAASIRRWVITMGLYIISLIAAASLLGAGVSALNWKAPGQSAFSLGFGTVDSRTLINSSLPDNLVSAVLLANLPQAICSFLYVTFNGLITSMLLAAEWSRKRFIDFSPLRTQADRSTHTIGYFLRPKPLRVTTRRGGQRSTYYLQLPYTYSVPLVLVSAILYWLLLESIFLVRIDLWRGARLGRSSSQGM